MFKKKKEKTLKHKFKNSCGNITILVLIMALVVLVLTSSMVAYLYRDVGFTELDKNKLRALNLAEAGIANMFLNIEKYNNNEISNLPTSPYTENVYTDSGIAGDYTVSHESYYVGSSFKIHGYSVTSKGTDNSGESRTVKVNLLSLNIYDFIYSQQAVSSAENIAGNTSIVGPFLVNGSLDLTVGSAQFLEGPLFVKEDIIIGGNASIGEADAPIVLFMGGSMFNVSGDLIDPLNPSGNEYIYVSDIYDIDFDIYKPAIDSTYISFLENQGAAVVEGDLHLSDNTITVNGVVQSTIGDAQNYIRHNNGILEIGGNIVVYGNIQLGEIPGRNFTIKYSGKANFAATGDIVIYSQTIPVTFTNFPSEDLLILTSLQNISLELHQAIGGSGIDDPNAALMCISNMETNLTTGSILRGGSISGSMSAAQNVVIYYEDGINNHLPVSVPSFGDILFPVDWQETIS